MDHQEFLHIIRSNEKIIYKICHIYREQEADREDLFQEIVFQLWKGYPSFRGEAKISTWIYRIAVNTALASFRKKTPMLSFQETLPEFADEPPDEEHRSRQDKLLHAMQKLEEADKALLTLYLEDLSYVEIGEIMGITENYVGVRLNRIKTKIQNLVKR